MPERTRMHVFIPVTFFTASNKPYSIFACQRMWGFFEFLSNFSQTHQSFIELCNFTKGFMAQAVVTEPAGSKIFRLFSSSFPHDRQDEHFYQWAYSSWPFTSPKYKTSGLLINEISKCRMHGWSLCYKAAWWPMSPAPHAIDKHGVK